MSLIRVKEATAIGEFRLRLMLTNGAVVERDISALLNGPIFAPLRQNPEMFRDLRVEGGTVVWGNGADLCPGGERGYEAQCLLLLGEVAARSDPAQFEAAEDHYGEALAIGEELGMRPLAAHCHLGFGTLYRRIGKRHEAREHLMTAATMLREMDMRFWPEQAEAELKALG